MRHVTIQFMPLILDIKLTGVENDVNSMVDIITSLLLTIREDNLTKPSLKAQWEFMGEDGGWQEFDTALNEVFITCIVRNSALNKVFITYLTIRNCLHSTVCQLIMGTNFHTRS